MKKRKDLYRKERMKKLRAAMKGVEFYKQFPEGSGIPLVGFYKQEKRDTVNEIRKRITARRYWK